VGGDQVIVDKPVPGVVTRPHPGGRLGSTIGLEEVAKKAWASRMSPRLRAWATQTLEKCGRPTGNRAKVQCLLDEFRRKVPYVNDPVMGEAMYHPEQTLCLDDAKGICIVGHDCDDGAIAMAAAVMSIGIPAMIVGASYHEPADAASHVYFAFKDDIGDWVEADTTTTAPVGTTSPALQKFWIDPAKDAVDRGLGDFIGVGGATTEGTLSGPRKEEALIDLWYASRFR
jgi:hypothetical protein